MTDDFAAAVTVSIPIFALAAGAEAPPLYGHGGSSGHGSAGARGEPESQHAGRPPGSGPPAATG